ncbi:hypothetical protein D3C74_392380 [compost metagenome]
MIELRVKSVPNWELRRLEMITADTIVEGVEYFLIPKYRGTRLIQLAVIELMIPWKK